jgi:Fur family transcriptional regulator, stress-responsive regulator
VTETHDPSDAARVRTADLSGATRLRAAGLRVTAPRVAVLEALESAPHSGVDVLVGAVQQRLGSVSTQAVYDILRALTGAGLVRRIEPAGSPALFETRVGDNHHHVVCRVCGRTQDVDCVVGDAPCLDPSFARGFDVDEAEITFWGLCPVCQQRGTETSEGTTQA